MSLSSNSAARMYGLVAKQRFEEAEILLKNHKPNGGIYLAGFAVECILKSLILANTTVLQRLGVLQELKTKYWHDLDALRKKAARHGLHMPPDVLHEFRRINTWDNNYRYNPGTRSIKDATLLLKSAETIITWAKRTMGETDG